MIDYTLSDGVVTLRLQSPPVNTITFALLDELRAAVRYRATSNRRSGPW